MSTDETTCLKVSFSGRVQGVGFRWTTKKMADAFEVTGYVKNMTDGTVEMMVEGDRSEAQRFLSSLRRHMADYIENCEVTELSDPKRHSHFTITY